jgi:hypothetical protein
MAIAVVSFEQPRIFVTIRGLCRIVRHRPFFIMLVRGIPLRNNRTGEV